MDRDLEESSSSSWVDRMVLSPDKYNKAKAPVVRLRYPHPSKPGKFIVEYALVGPRLFSQLMQEDFVDLYQEIPEDKVPTVWDGITIRNLGKGYCFFSDVPVRIEFVGVASDDQHKHRQWSPDVLD